jgi:hypothetical protein
MAACPPQRPFFGENIARSKLGWAGKRKVFPHCIVVEG